MLNKNIFYIYNYSFCHNLQTNQAFYIESIGKLIKNTQELENTNMKLKKLAEKDI